MKKELIYITCCPIDTYFSWQVLLWLQSLKDVGESDKAHVLLYHPKGREVPKEWSKIEQLFPEVRIKKYEDVTLRNLLPLYIPVLRPFLMSNYLAENPELCNKAIFYCDSDVLFTRKVDVDKYLDDDASYLSDTVGYIGAEYIQGKKKDVLPKKAKEFEKRDILDEMCKLIGVSKEVAIANQSSSGGAQYLLKGTDAKFWEKVMKDCIVIKLHLDAVNRQFFENGNIGYQSWCADMWAVLYNLWHRGYETKVVPEMNFAWATDPIEKLQDVAILHNAGVTNEENLRSTQKGPDGKNLVVNAPAFYKGKFVNGTSPWHNMGYLYNILTNEYSKKYCTHYYTDFLIKQKDKL